RGLSVRGASLPTIAGQGDNFAIFAGCRELEQSSENGPLAITNGFFTRALLEGLQGKADANNDGVVTLAEVNAYVAKRVPYFAQGFPQNPNLTHTASFNTGLALAVTGGNVVAANAPPAAKTKTGPVETGPVETGPIAQVK